MEKIQREKRSLEDLNVIDDFLMNAAASDREGGEEFCRLILSTLLEREVGKIHINTQKVISAGAPNLRGIRMDVEIIESAGELINVYDIEPCRYHKRGLEKSNRFYQAKIDSRYMESGERDFTKLPNLYIITILPYDPFGENYMMYQIINQCLEVPGLEYKDGLRYIYFNTTGKKGGSPAIRELLQYFQNSTETNARSERLQRIHEHVKKVKVLPEVREEFMRLDDIIYYEREEADQNRAVQDILELLEDCGEVSEELKNKIKVQTDKETLRRWHKLAARAESLEEFKTKM
ncbi:hypothetical protein [Laedolimicola ammoniilytica]|uniref:PD-(D/E)XK nuclease family transposase n=1 Tax=Laedolimicola ammoniilytica TaxID=2981771 RepID=A0ABT2RT78_9FIRM|nr:hypothetical protein [Laedolimicola ammoniilytica]MCU6695509.1 hypothetical protein [Laedolimicola ammoniilytica]SCH01482.1 Uncharacterised protein [uncultured Clostridium sp.]